MIHGRQNLLAWFKTNDKPYFSIFRKNATESGNTVFNNKGKENETIETAAAYLDQCLNLISSGDFFIFCCKEAGSSTSKGRSETFFTVSSSESAPAPQVAAISGMGMDYETMLAKASEMAETKFKGLMLDKELKDLKEQNALLLKDKKELESNLQQPWNKLMKEVSPYIGSIAQQFGLTPAAPAMAAQMAVSGTADDTHIEPATDDQEQVMSATVNAFCEALAARYPDRWLIIIANLTNTLQTSPEKIDMALKFL